MMTETERILNEIAIQLQVLIHLQCGSENECCRLRKMAEYEVNSHLLEAMANDRQ